MNDPAVTLSQQLLEVDGLAWKVARAMSLRALDPEERLFCYRLSRKDLFLRINLSIIILWACCRRIEGEGRCNRLLALRSRRRIGSEHPPLCCESMAG